MSVSERIQRRTAMVTFETSARFGQWLGRKVPHVFGDQRHRFLRMTARMTSAPVERRYRNVNFRIKRIADVPCRIYWPKLTNEEDDGGATDQLRPLVVFIHGGGWTVASARSYHEFTARLCRDTGAIVASIDYSLAPENPYPKGYNDCLAVVKHLTSEDGACSKIIDDKIPPFNTKQVVLCGDSAGGNLSACVALDLVRSREIKRLAAIVLICPVTQAIDLQLSSYLRYAPKCGGLDWFLAMYSGLPPKKNFLKALRNNEHTERIKVRISTQNQQISAESQLIPEQLIDFCSNPLIWPILAAHEHLAQLPATFLQSCEFDPLFDENEAFAEKLRQNGPVLFRYETLKAAMHDESVFSHILKTKAARDGYRQIVDFIQEIFNASV